MQYCRNIDYFANVNINLIDKYDRALSFSFCLLALVYPYIKHVDPYASFAIYNAVVSFIPIVVVLFSSKLISIRIIDIIGLTVLLSIVSRIITLLANMNYLAGQSLLLQLALDTTVIMNLLFIYFVLRGINKGCSSLKKIHRWVFLFAVIFSIYNIITNYETLTYLHLNMVSSLIRFSSYFTNTNNFGLFLFMSVIGATYVLIDEYHAKRKSSIIKKLMIISYVFIIINLILTFSRTAIFSTVIFLGVFMLLKKGRVREIFMILTGFIVLTSILQIGEISLFVDTYIIKAEQGVSGRNSIWLYGLQLAAEHPFFGYGKMYGGSFLQVFSGNMGFHNMFIQAMVSGGLLGFLYTIIFTCYSVYVGKQVYKNNKVYGALAIASVLSIISYGMFEGEEFFGFGLFSFMLTLYGIIMPLILKKVYSGGRINYE